ncbi:unnamed protein product, partial [Didymodactylos carnosus]
MRCQRGVNPLGAVVEIPMIP